MRNFGVLAAMTLMGLAGVASAGDAMPKGCVEKGDALQNMKKYGTSDGMSRGTCRIMCVDDAQKKGLPGFATMAIANEDCWCGQTLPNEKLFVDDGKCKQTCPGYGKEFCMFLCLQILIR